MKKWSILAAVFVLVAALGCGELSDENGDADIMGGEGTGEGVGEGIGDGAGVKQYTWLLIKDKLQDPQKCNTNPGADIDAVQVFRNGSEIGTAGGNPVYVEGTVCDTNTANDPKQILGEPDEDNPEDSDNKFVSLNGGHIAVQCFGQGSNDPIVFQNGDTIQVYESYISDKPDTKEGYEVYICTDSAGNDCVGLGEGAGDGTFTVTGI